MEWSKGKLRIAVIGSGISGLGTALLLSKKHKIFLFEQNDRFGGHSNTVSLHLNSKKVSVDTGFIVFNNKNYEKFSKLLDHLNVQSKWSDMSLGFSFDDGKFEYACDDLDKIFAQRKNLANPKYLWALLEILKFNKEGPKLLNAGHLSGLSMEDFLKKYRYSDFFKNRFILPMAGAIWPASMDKISDFPAENFITFFKNHDLMTGLKPAQRWRTLSYGSGSYVKEIIKRLSNNVYNSMKVSSIIRKDDNCRISFSNGTTKTFDHVVFAIPGAEIKNILKNQSSEETKILSKFKITKNKAILHSDKRFMPKLGKVWSSWNFLHNSTSTLESTPPSVTYWMNRLQGIDGSTPLFVSLNPNGSIDQDKIFYETEYVHPQFDSEIVKAQAEINKIQGKMRIWYAGAWLGYGFHEDGFLSAVNIARAFDCLPEWLN